MGNTITIAKIPASTTNELQGRLWLDRALAIQFNWLAGYATAQQKFVPYNLPIMLLFQSSNQSMFAAGGGGTHILTLNCMRYPTLPLVHKHWTPLRKPLSHQNFLIICTPYIYTLITTIFQGKQIKYMYHFQNGGQITNFHFATFRFRPKFEKPLSQRNISVKLGSN